MHPTIDEQLAGAERLLTVIESDSALSASSAEAVANVRRLLKQIGRSWPELLPFYLADNDRLLDLLASAPHAVPGAAAPTGAVSVAAAAARNAELRQALSDAIHQLSDDAASDSFRSAALAYLVARTDTDPS